MTTSRQVLTGTAIGAVLGATALVLQSRELGTLNESVRIKESELAAAPPLKRTVRDAAARKTDALAPVDAAEDEAAKAARLTPDQVIDLLRELENAEDPVRASLKMLSAMQYLPADRIPEAMAVIKAWKRPFINMGVVPVLYARWGELDPEAAMASATKNDMDAPLFPFFGGPNGPKGNIALQLGVFAGWMGKDPGAAMTWIKTENPFGSRGGSNDTEEAAGVMAIFLSADKSRSQAIADTMPQEKRLSVMAKAGLIDTDTPEAMDRALAQATTPEARKALLREGIGDMVQTDPNAAMAYLMKQPADERGPALQGAFREWAREDPSKAMDWYAAQPADARKDLRPQDMAWQFGDRNPEEVRAFAGKMPDDAAKNEFIVNSVQQRTWNNPSEAAGMLGDITDPKQQANSARNIGQNWGRQNQEKAAEWIGTQPEGPVRDSAVQGFADSAWQTHKDGEAAAVWLGTISDETQRTAALTGHVTQWMQKDPAAAGEWLTGSDSLTEEQKAAIINSAQKGGAVPPVPMPVD